MKYYCGIDGGGTKTAFLLIDECGAVHAALETAGSSYRTIGEKGVADLYEKAVETCLRMAGADRTSLAGIAAGVPCYGEDRRADETLKEYMAWRFREIPLYLCNDAEVGWAGSLGLRPGINIVAGTGSIAFGRNSRGETARCGGWSTFFGDEGSCFWLGRKTAELFLKQMDGRAGQGRLYEIIMDRFGLKCPEEFIALLEEDYVMDRRKVAELQKYLLLAAQEGDCLAAALYLAAADELGMMLAAAAKRLRIREETLYVSLSGGLLHAARFFMDRFLEWVAKAGGEFVSPEMTPVQGAALLAARKFSEADVEEVKENMKQTMRKYRYENRNAQDERRGCARQKREE